MGIDGNPMGIRWEWMGMDGNPMRIDGNPMGIRWESDGFAGYDHRFKGSDAMDVLGQDCTRERRLCPGPGNLAAINMVDKRLNEYRPVFICL